MKVFWFIFDELKCLYTLFYPYPTIDFLGFQLQNGEKFDTLF